MSGAAVTDDKTKTKTKRNRAPMTFMLVAMRKDAGGEVIGFDLVTQPALDKENPTRADYKRAVRKALETGESPDYNGKQLTVVGFPEPFCFKAEVKEEVIRKVDITEA